MLPDLSIFYHSIQIHNSALSALGATELLQGVYGVDKELTLSPDGLYVLTDELRDRFHDALNDLARRVKSRSLLVA